MIDLLQMTEVIRIVERTGSRALAKKHKKPPIYQKSEYDGFRKAGRFNAQLMDFIRPSIREGITTNELDKLAYDYTLDHGHIPACLDYPGQNGPYPKTICTSINEVVCHGVPDDRPLLEGDILNIDLTTIVDGWHGDQSETFLIGDVSREAKICWARRCHDNGGARKQFGHIWNAGFPNLQDHRAPT